MIYYEKQSGNMCRMHAINNFVGRQLYTTEQFNKLCDEFDLYNKFSEMTSKNNHTFYNNSGIKNIFGYALIKKGISIDMEAFDTHRQKNIEIEDMDTFMGAIVFNTSHTWCVRNIDDNLYIIDSMGGNPSITQKSYFNNKGLNFVMIYENIKLPDYR